MPFPGLLSIIHKADPVATLLLSPIPIAKRSTFSASKLAISEEYCLADSGEPLIRSSLSPSCLVVMSDKIWEKAKEKI